MINTKGRKENTRQTQQIKQNIGYNSTVKNTDSFSKQPVQSLQLWGN